MKIIDRIALVIFSLIVLILSMMLCFLIFGWINLAPINYTLMSLLGNQTACNVTIGVCIVLILLALKCIFFTGHTNENFGGNGILLENDNGKLLISKDTLMNLVNGLAKRMEKVEDVSSKVFLDKENNLRVYITLFVEPDTVIKDLSVKLQTKVKEAIKKTSDLDVKEVDIRIKNVTPVGQTKQAEE